MSHDWPIISYFIQSQLKGQKQTQETLNKTRILKISDRFLYLIKTTGNFDQLFFSYQ